MKKVRIYLIVSILLFAFQMIGYLGDLTAAEQQNKAMVEKDWPFWIGYNVFLLFGIFFLFMAFYAKRKHRKKQTELMIMAIGNNVEN